MVEETLENELKRLYKKYIDERKEFAHSLSPDYPFENTVDAELLESVGMFKEAAIVDGIDDWMQIFEQIISGIRGAVKDAEEDMKDES